VEPSRPVEIALLSVLRPKERAKVLAYARRQTYQPGDEVVREGDPGMHLYFVIDGHARVGQAGQDWVGRLQPGDFFGELALIEEHGRTATVVAEDELTCMLVPAWEFRALLKEHPELAVELLHALIGRLHRREHHAR
jgi:cAMP-binding proteins - catabolite gene activator and regulatory subunit of cAMP-dependent protein kinases